MPATLDRLTICAELKDGTLVEGREKIPQVTYDKVTEIQRIYISPSNCVAAPGVVEAISEADAIIIGPGSLYTDVLPNLLVKNISKSSLPASQDAALKSYSSIMPATFLP